MQWVYAPLQSYLLHFHFDNILTPSLLDLAKLKNEVDMIEMEHKPTALKN